MLVCYIRSVVRSILDLLLGHLGPNLSPQSPINNIEPTCAQDLSQIDACLCLLCSVMLDLHYEFAGPWPGRVRSSVQVLVFGSCLDNWGGPGGPARGNRGIRSRHPAQVAPGKRLPQAPIFQHNLHRFQLHFRPQIGLQNRPRTVPKPITKSISKFIVSWRCFLSFHTLLAAVLQTAKPYFERTLHCF